MLRPAGKILLRAAIVVVVIISAVASTVVWRLSTGPISLAFLSPLVRQALSFGDAGYRAEFDDTVLTWGGWDRTLDVRALGVRVIDASGTMVGAVPELAVELSAWALLRGMIAPTALEFFGPSAFLVRDADGRITLGNAPPHDQPRDRRGVGAVIAALATELAGPPSQDKAIGFLTRLTITGADITLIDERTGKTWRLPSADLVFRRHDLGLAGTVRGDVEVAGKTVAIAASGRYENASGEASLDIDFTNLDPEILAGEPGLVGRLAALQMPLAGTASIRLARGFGLRSVSFDVDAGAGQVYVPALYAAPRAVGGLSLAGTFDAEAKRLTVDALFLRLGNTTFDGQGVIDLGGKGPSVKIFADVANLTVDDIKLYWPETRAPNARLWVLTNLHEGLFPVGNLQININPDTLREGKLTGGAIDFRFRFEGLAARYLRQFPWLTGGRGFGRVTPEFLDATFEAAGTGGVRITGGRLFLDQIHRRGFQTADIDVDFEATLAEALALLDHWPLTVIGNAGINPADGRGDTVTSANFKFPLKKGIKLPDVSYSARSELRGAEIVGLLKSVELANGYLTMDVTPAGLEAVGQVTLNGVPAKVIWTESISDRTELPTRYAIQATLEGPQLTALGLPGEGFVEGPVYAELHLVGRGADIADGVGFFDLREADIGIDEIGWSKPVGEQAVLDVELRTVDGRLVVDSFSLMGGGLEADGNFSLDSENSLSLFNFSRLDIGETRLKAQARRTPGGIFDVEISGEAFDARPLLHSVLSGGDAGHRLPDLEVSMSVDRVVTENSVELRNLLGTLRHQGDQWIGAKLSAAIAADKVIEVSLERTANKRHLSITSGDAGRVVLGLGVYNSGKGGALALTAMIDDAVEGGPVVGDLSVADFRILNAPVLTRILTIGSLTGIGDLLQGEGITFKELTVPFTLREGVLDIKDARAHGAAIGFTLDGWVDIDRETLDLDGTIIPAYTLNSLLAKMPIIGTILAGPGGEGVFAFTYKVSGARDQPKVSVNPLSALAPGILRALFSGGPRSRPREPEAAAEIPEEDVKDEADPPSEPEDSGR